MLSTVIRAVTKFRLCCMCKLVLATLCLKLETVFTHITQEEITIKLKYIPINDLLLTTYAYNISFNIIYLLLPILVLPIPVLGFL